MITKIHKVTAWQTQDGSLFINEEDAVKYDVEYAKKIESNENKPKIGDK